MITSYKGVKEVGFMELFEGDDFYDNFDICIDEDEIFPEEDLHGW